MSEWQDIKTAKKDWSHPVYIAWWQDGHHKLAGRRVAFSGIARWYSANLDGSGEWQLDDRNEAIPEDRVYAWTVIPTPPPPPDPTNDH